MNKYSEHDFIEGDRILHIETGKLATFTGTRREVKGADFDFVRFDDGRTCFFYPSEIKEQFKKVI